MSGRAERAYFSFAQAAGLPDAAERRARLAAALVLSSLLHALAVVMPSPGTGTSSPSAAPRSLEVRLDRSETPAPAANPAKAATVWTAVPPPAVPPSPEPEGARTTLSRGLNLLPTPADPYFTTDRLTRQPAATSHPSLTIPSKTARYVTGRVALKVWINEFGGVEKVEVEHTDLPAPVASIPADAFRKVHFFPGEIDGRAVGVLMRIEITYVDGRVAQ